MVVPSYLPGYSFQCSDLMIIAYWFQDAIKYKNGISFVLADVRLSPPTSAIVKVLVFYGK